MLGLWRVSCACIPPGSSGSLLLRKSTASHDTLTIYFLKQIFPFRIQAIDQFNLLFARTCFDLLFTENCHVYIMTNSHNTVLNTGVTNNIYRRVLEHRSGKGGYFTNKYKQLIYISAPLPCLYLKKYTKNNEFNYLIVI